MSGAKSVVHVAVEVGQKKTFASALDWPGWARSGKDEAAAIETLLDYAERYRVVTDRAGIEFEPGEIDVVERLAGISFDRLRCARCDRRTRASPRRRTGS